jgi:hypothetical protein
MSWKARGDLQGQAIALGMPITGHPSLAMA